MQWDRVTISKITTIYFIFSVLHCLIQIVFQVQAFNINATAASFLSNIIAQGNATVPGFAVLGPDLQWCTSVPNSGDTSSCPVIWSGKGANNAVAPASMAFNTSLPSGSARLSTSAASPTSQTSFIPPASLAAAQSASATPSSAARITATPSATTSTPSALSVPGSNTAVSESPSAISMSGSAVAVSESGSPTVSHVVSSATSVSGTSSASGTSSSDTPPSVARIPSESEQASTSASTTVIVVTVAPTAFSRVPNVAVPSESVTRTFTVVVGSTVTPTPAVDTEEEGDAEENEHVHHKREAQVVGALSSSGTREVQVNDFYGDKQVTLDDKCLLALNWPNSQVENTKREDIVFICFQIWVLGMSIVALLNESIPHIFASLLTHIVATAWGGFQIYNTKLFRADFVRLTTNGACGVNLLPTYWKMRANAEIPSLVMNCFALLVSAFLSWRLIKLFGWQTFKRVGASFTINRVYNVVLVLSIVIQLSGFFIIVSGGLWIDQVFNGDIGRMTQRATFFKVMMVIVLILLIPWLATGWISVRRELKVPMLVFLLFSLLYFAGWAAMFVSNTFRWTFLQWRFFSLMTSASVFLTVVTFILGITCRVNFGKGLRRHLEAQERLDDDDPTDYEEANFEKVPFPSSNNPIPTFSAAFGSGPEVPPPSQMNFAARTMGPRFYGPSTFDLTSAIAYGVPARVVSPPQSTYSTSTSEKALSRHGSESSQHSITSTSNSSDSGHSSRSKRWIIE